MAPKLGHERICLMLNRGWSLVVAALMFAAFGCSPSIRETSDASGSATDAIAPTDSATVDSGVDANQPQRDDAGGADDATRDEAALGDAGTSSSEDTGDAAPCFESLETYCAEAGAGAAISCGAKCILDWTTALQPAQWCPYGGGARAYPDCDGFNLIVIQCGDTDGMLYYDVASLKLVRIEGLSPAPRVGGTRNTCLAGQPGRSVQLLGTQPDCWDGGLVPLICSSDASSD